MKLIVDHKPITLTKTDFVAKGGEGSVYVKGKTAYKIYEDTHNCLPVGKIQELSSLSLPTIIKPEHIITDEKGNHRGYTMGYVPKGSFLLCELFPFSFKNDHNITNDKIGELVKELKKTVEHIHSKDILVVDMNENNFMMSKDFKNIYAIDTDSYQTKSFDATAIMPSIHDPHCNGKFSEVTDWYSFAILSCQMFLGIHPFKGKYPNMRGFLKRMEANISIFNDDVTVPNIIPSFDVIPEVYRNWYKAVFDRGERCLPPESFENVLQIVRTLKTIKSNDSFNIVEVFKTESNIINAFYSNGQRIAIASDGTIYLNNRQVTTFKNKNKRLYVGNDAKIQVCAYIEQGQLKLHDLTHNVELDVDVACDDIMSYKGRIYVKSGNTVIEVSYKHHTNKTLVITDVVSQIMPNSSRMFDGCAIQLMLQNFYVSLYTDHKTEYQLPLDELKGQRIISAKFDKNVLSVIGQNKGVYNKYIYKYNSKFSDYDVQEKLNISILENNFTVLDNDIVASINDDENLEIFVAKMNNGQGKIVEDDTISSSMALFSHGVQTMFYQNNKIFSITMK